MKEKLEKFERERLMGYKQNKKLIVIYVAVMVFLATAIPLTVWFYSNVVDKEIIMFFVVMGILAFGTLILFFITGELKSRYERSLRKEIIETVSNETFYSNVNFSEDELSNIGFLSDYVKNNSFHKKQTKNELTGKYKNLNFKMFNLRLLKETEYYIYITFNGQYLEFDLKDKDLKDLVIYSKEESITKFDKRLNKVKTNNIEFDKKYNFLTNDENFYKKIMNDEFINKIFNLEKEYEGTYSFIIKDGKFTILLSSDIDFLKLDLSRSMVNGESYKKINEELRYVKNIYDAFSEILKTKDF